MGTLTGRKPKDTYTFLAFIDSLRTLDATAQMLLLGDGTPLSIGFTNLGTYIDGTLEVSGNATVSGTFDATGVVTLGSSLAVTTTAEVGGTLTVSGATICETTLAVTGNATVGGTLDVAGTTTLAGALDVTGAGVFAGALSFGTTLSGSDANFSGDVAVSGGATVGEDLDVTTNATVGGTLGVTGTATLGRLILAAGGTGAGTAPLKLTSQAAGLTAVEQGAFELIGNSLQFTQLLKRRGVTMSQTVLTSSTTVENTVTESASLITAEHGPTYLEVGKMEEMVLHGTLEQRSAVGAVLTFNIKYAGSTIHSVATSATNAISAGSPFLLRVTATCRSTGATGTMQINSWLEVPNEVSKGGNTLATIDTTTAQNTTITAVWGEANASNKLVVQQGRVLCIEPNR